MNTRLYRPGRAERSRRGRVAGPLRAGARAEPLFEPDLVLPAAGRLGGGGEALLTVEDGPDWTACLPVQAVRWHGWRVPVLMSWRHSYCFLGTPLLDPEAPLAALGRVLDQALPRARAGMLALDAVGWDGGFADALETAMTERGRVMETYRSHERATLVRREEAGYHEGMRARPDRGPKLSGQAGTGRGPVGGVLAGAAGRSEVGGPRCAGDERWPGEAHAGGRGAGRGERHGEP